MMTSAAHEWRRELRRQASNGRLPFDVRLRLREMADASTVRRDANRFPRRLLLAPSTISLPPALLEQTRMELRARGLTDCTRLVTFESRTRPDIARAAVAFLRGEGYTVVRIGDRGEQMRSGDGLLDLRTVDPQPPLLEMCLVAASTFVVCESSSLQHLAYATNTPSLVINAREPFAAYPVRRNGLFALCTPIDLETAHRITFADMLSEPYFRDLRKQEARGRRRGSYGYFDNTAEELIEALREMTAGAAAGWTNETESQARFRDRVVTAGAALAAVSPHVAEWGPDEGFIGDGRLVAFQADSVS
jgi:putative glycosyltransferase (TIGR04372 family)